MVKKVSDFKTAQIYAQALYESAQSESDMNEIMHDVEVLKNVGLSEMKEASCFLSPIVELKVKYQIIEAVSDKMKLNKLSLNFLKTLIENGKFKYLDQILNDFVKIYNKKHNISEITVETVRELDQKQDNLLKEKLTKLFKQEVKINYVLNQKILGGLVIKNGTTLIDMSLKNQLKKIEQLMKGTE